MMIFWGEVLIWFIIIVGVIAFIKGAVFHRQGVEMATQQVIQIMDEFNWDVEYICQALIEARAELEELQDELNDVSKKMEQMEIEGDF